MRAFKKSASFCLAMLLLISSLAACGTPSETSAEQTETLDVVFSFHPQEGGLTITPLISKTILAGDDAWDLIHIASSYDNMQSLIQY